MFNFLKFMCGCCGCGSSASKEEKKNQYKCQSCGSLSREEAGECCGAKRENVCDCGSGKYTKDCCEA